MKFWSVNLDKPHSKTHTSYNTKKKKAFEMATKSVKHTVLVLLIKQFGYVLY